MPNYEQSRRVTDIVQDLAETLGVSEGLVWRRMKRGPVLGVTYRDGLFIHEYGSGQPGFQGPVPDKFQEYLVPRGTKAVALEPLPGPVSGQVFQGRLVTRRSITTVELATASNCSGVIQHLTFIPPG
jgi:hypothetical protein